MKYSAETNVLQDVGNFVGDVNLLDPLSTFHQIKALLPASRILATACQERKWMCFQLH